MRVAFYAPLKPPHHPVPSGDRRMARLFMQALEVAGHDVVLASSFRSYDRDGDAHRQRRLAALGARLAARIVRRRPRYDLWFTYHLYHKAPDHLGPPVSRALGIPYVAGEASVAAKQARGAWAIGYEASLAALRRADLILALTAVDRVGLEAAVGRARLRLVLPFLDPAPFGLTGEADRRRTRDRLASERRFDPGTPLLLTVAMMRDDAKLASYRLLAEALSLIRDRPWHLLVVGGGDARAAVEAALAPLAHKVSFLGELAAERLPPLYAAADLYVWPAVREAYGLAMLEAQAAGLPVVAGREGGVGEIVVDGGTGLLADPRDPAALASAIATLLDDAGRRRAMGEAARGHVAARHSLAAAADRLGAALANAQRRPLCASA